MYLCFSSFNWMDDYCFFLYFLPFHISLFYLLVLRWNVKMYSGKTNYSFTMIYLIDFVSPSSSVNVLFSHNLTIKTLFSLFQNMSSFHFVQDPILEQRLINRIQVLLHIVLKLLVIKNSGQNRVKIHLIHVCLFLFIVER